MSDNSQFGGQDLLYKARLRYKCANCKFIFDEYDYVRQLTRDYEIRCPHCNSNAVDRVNNVYKRKGLCKHFQSSQDRQCLFTENPYAPKNCIGYEICENYKEAENKE